jgi:hypothetical protein
MKLAANCRPRSGTELASHRGIVIIRTLGKAALLLVPLALVGMRLHARASRTPAEVTGEVNRAMSLVRVAASKRGSGATVRNRDQRPTRGDGPKAGETPI